MISEDRSGSTHRPYRLALRGAQQMDLALRFAAGSDAAGLSVLALKGISIADQLYAGIQNRPMADIDFLTVNSGRFGAMGDLARSLGLVEIGASDHALVFREPSSRVVLELHLALTACPGLFTVDAGALWERRAVVPGTAMFRLSDPDLVVHLALHTAFQHAFTANEYHYGDFVRALEKLRPPLQEIVARAREWSALGPVGAMALVSFRKNPDSSRVAELAALTESFCPPGLARWIGSQPEMPPPFSVASLARVRYHLAPSKWRYLARTLAPKSIPGRTLSKPGVMRRLASLAAAAMRSPVPADRPLS
jgi:hypothetical protein